jgi:hypothetical protein
MPGLDWTSTIIFAQPGCSRGRHVRRPGGAVGDQGALLGAGMEGDRKEGDCRPEQGSHERGGRCWGQTRDSLDYLGGKNNRSSGGNKEIGGQQGREDKSGHARVDTKPAKTY